jgi:hypothetical protein
MKNRVKRNWNCSYKFLSVTSHDCGYFCNSYHTCIVLCPGKTMAAHQYTSRNYEFNASMLQKPGMGLLLSGKYILFRFRLLPQQLPKNVQLLMPIEVRLWYYRVHNNYHRMSCHCSTKLYTLPSSSSSILAKPTIRPYLHFMRSIIIFITILLFVLIKILHDLCELLYIPK